MLDMGKPGRKKLSHSDQGEKWTAYQHTSEWNARCRLVFKGLALGLIDVRELQQLDVGVVKEQTHSCSCTTQSQLWVLRSTRNTPRPSS
jgi:hypothetical protein